jgi:hypothetical protein
MSDRVLQMSERGTWRGDIVLNFEKWFGTVAWVNSLVVMVKERLL